MNSKPVKAVFLDRDGTLNEEISYLYRPEDWRWLPGVIEGLLRLREAGYLLIVISNQAGIARGYYTQEDVHALHRWVNSRLETYGAGIDAFYFCPHHPEFTPGGCACRKPSPLLIKKAAHDFGIDLSQSWMIGDKALDYEAGTAAGCASILVETGYGTSERAALAPGASVVSNFSEAVEAVLKTLKR